MDQILTFADTQLAATTSDERRSSIVASMLAVGAPAHSRLIYRPEPIGSTFPLGNFTVTIDGEPALMEQIDTSYALLVQDFTVLQGDEDLELPYDEPGLELMQYLPNGLRGQGARFLTYLDAYACLPELRRTEMMEGRVKLIQWLYDDLDGFVRGVMAQAARLNQHESMLLKLKLHVYSFRLILYFARLQGWEQDRLSNELTSNFATYFQTYMVSPPSVLRSRLAEVRGFFENQRLLLRASQGSFGDSAAPELAGELPGVREISVPAAEVSETAVEQCSICLLDPGSAAVLTKSCSHAFCDECLETWIHAGQENSHRCPMCRTELFSMSSYQPKQLELSMEDMRLYVTLGRWIDQTRSVDASLYWLQLEMELHYRVISMGA
ncbi:hypothetical protein PTNB85_07352 [Pyrenophora teres f. teres]|uniref:RING-finger-containing ubiquitin ligase n=1 Tax=Pyrenophora teres f. teres TaxID=97479 RepID=A0A6S6W5L8_9PLEO|nr:hypothetical protein HRS9139_07386 [Pyrenophora teres f. teres]KAE8830765.1 hypothetical protein PTNB85_07352 [Pyrenophora teres f. teres]KAE8857237.1 hypothetical protein PTNB29_08304 [Pyrenophora teres f. teres]CAE7186983.1 RING-finger-containing ubiquitin ligase [Pyrenophora teres f. teres]